MDFVDFIEVVTEKSIAQIQNPGVLPEKDQYITIEGVMYQCVSAPDFFYRVVADQLEGSVVYVGRKPGRVMYSAQINVRRVAV